MEEIPVAQISTKLHLESARVRLQQLLESNAPLTSGQNACAEQIKERIKERTKTLEKEAVEWLSKCNKRLELKKDLYDLAQDLNEPHEFLPEKHVPEYKKLKGIIQALRDQDISGKIITWFKKIGDKKQQQQVIQKLKKLIE